MKHVADPTPTDGNVCALYNGTAIQVAENERRGIHFHYSTVIMQFNYLGVNITSSGNLVREIKTQAQKSGRVAAV